MSDIPSSCLWRWIQGQETCWHLTPVPLSGVRVSYRRDPPSTGVLYKSTSTRGDVLYKRLHSAEVWNKPLELLNTVDPVERKKLIVHRNWNWFSGKCNQFVLKQYSYIFINTIYNKQLLLPESWPSEERQEDDETQDDEEDDHSGGEERGRAVRDKYLNMFRLLNYSS